jgi:uncharacterized protein YutE (UPF0331/DUF86 family)
MIDMARFRNLLVRVYWGIDHERLYESLPARLATLEALLERIGQWLQQQAREEGIGEQ